MMKMHVTQALKVTVHMQKIIVIVMVTVLLAKLVLVSVVDQLKKTAQVTVVVQQLKMIAVYVEAMVLHVTLVLHYN